MLAANSTIGILGGGQLARMLANAAHDLGFKTHIYAPEGDSPAFDVTRYHTQKAYDDKEALREFAAKCDVITYEFENVPYDTAEFLNSLTPVYPPPSALKITQDRWLEKSLIKQVGLNTPAFFDINSVETLEKALLSTSYPAILKTRRFGYDGKGQVKITKEMSASEALLAVKNAPSLLESYVPFDLEVSVILARNTKGETAVYELCENEHKNHILHITTVPSKISIKTQEKALESALKLANKLDYIGVLAVELFIKGDEILVNEMAPRVHNSGHWTLGGAVTSQFHQHIRAISGMPLGSTRRLGAISMLNLIGDDVEDYEAHLKTASYPVLYGKKESRAGRKMGHITKIS